MKSNISSVSIKSKYDEIHELYQKDSFPWIIGYSGGKDSTVTLQLIYSALKELPSKIYHKKVYVVSSDTLVELPSVIERLNETLNRLDEQAKKDGIPLTCHKVTPDADSTFFVNIIGRGYPSPTRTFRWCTDRMKISPTTRFIQSTISEAGQAVIILGSRRKESSTRAQTMLNHEIKGSILKRHTSLTNAFVYTPIENWDVEEVWNYLLVKESPWGDDNEALEMMYRKAGGDECPLVIDTSTPSCGNSRFGCWTCTVISQDKSIQGFIDNGESWLQPMADYRDKLLRWREEREKRREPAEDRIGGYGPFTPDSRIKLLEDLLKVEKEVKQKYGERLIHAEELWAIQKIWDYDGRFKTKVSDIYNKVYDIKIKEKNVSIKKRNIEEDIELQNLCEKHDISYDLIQRLLFLENDISKMRRGKGLYERIDREMRELLS